MSNNSTNGNIIYRNKVKSGIYNKMIIQFVEKEKRLKKGVDIWGWVWYYNKAVARGAKKQEKNGCGSGPEGIQRHGNGAFGFQFLNGSSKIKNKKV